MSRIIPTPDPAVRPVVLITTSATAKIAEYEEAMFEAGAEPVRLDVYGDGVTSLDRAQGVVLSGGGDIDPGRYGGADSPLIDDVDSDRDAFEIAVLKAARQREMPTFCICRGLQIANVAFGGSLIADIPSALGLRNTIPHERPVNGRNERGLLEEHIVRIESDSALARIVGTAELVTGARHHQAVERCATDLRIVARTDDGIVEALEARFASPFWLAVQWHPESTRALDGGPSRALFSALVDAAHDYKPVTR